MRRPHPERPGPESCPPIPDGPWPPVKPRPYASSGSCGDRSVDGERKRPSGSGREGRSASPRQVSGMSRGVRHGRGDRGETAVNGTRVVLGAVPGRRKTDKGRTDGTCDQRRDFLLSCRRIWRRFSASARTPL